MSSHQEIFISSNNFLSATQVVGQATQQRQLHNHDHHLLIRRAINCRHEAGTMKSATQQSMPYNTTADQHPRPNGWPGGHAFPVFLTAIRFSTDKRHSLPMHGRVISFLQINRTWKQQPTLQ